MDIDHPYRSTSGLGMITARKPAMHATGFLSRSYSSNVVRGFLIAIAAATVGWQAALLTKDHHLTPGEAIAHTWMAQFTTLAKSSGEARSPDDVLIAAQITLLAETLGMALHHAQIEEDQWKYIEPRLPTSVALMPTEAKARMQAVVDCMTAARKRGSMDTECVREALKIPFP